MYNIGEAQDSFESACDLVKAEITKRGFLLPMIAEIALGSAVPGLSTSIATAADRIPVASSTLKTWAASFFVDEAKVKGYLGKAVSVGFTVLKQMPATNGAADFIDGLKAHSKLAFAQVTTTLNGASIEELMAVWGAYHPAVVTVDAYAGALRDLASRYQKQVEPIRTPNGRMAGLAMVTNSQQAVYVDGKLALVKVTDKLTLENLHSPAKPSQKLKFVEWISQDIAEFALRQTKSIHGEVMAVKKDSVDFK